jgi:hypothetical protein
MRAVRHPVLLLVVLACGCSRSSALSNDPSASSTAAASASTAPAKTPAPATDAGRAAHWTGTYRAEPGPLFVPEGPEWAGVRFRGEDAGTGLGEGTVSLTINPEGEVEGAVDGPLGPLRAHGWLTAGKLGASLDPADAGSAFSGTAAAQEEGGKIVGAMHVSSPLGNVIRAAPFTLERKP